MDRPLRIMRSSIEGNIGIIVVDNPPVNAITLQVRIALLEALREFEANEAVKKCLLLCAGHTFFSGGDISEFDGPPPPPHLPDVVDAFENSRLITLAAIHGNCFGGGFEMALGCDYRLALRGAKFAFPEVNLGLIPGAGGTQRLPRLIGLEKASEMMASGRPSRAPRMLELGAIDKMIEAPLRENAIRYLQHVTHKLEPISKRTVTTADLASLQDKFGGKARAPLLNIEAASWTLEDDFDAGQAKERALHLKLRQSEESQALRHVFFAERAASRPTAIAGANGHELHRVAVIGGGLMGVGIAASALMAGKVVLIIERDEQGAERAKAHLHEILDGAHARGKLSASPDEVLNRFHTSTQIDAVQQADLVIEAVFEDLEVKKNLFAQIAEHAGERTILTTNTSYLDPEEILPDAFHTQAAGLHFFSPAHIMKLVEVAKLPATSAETLASLFKFSRELKKLPVLAGICEGFIGNRMLSAYRREADYLLADGALPAQIDQAMREFGMTMGPFEAQDMSGLQIAWANRQRNAPRRNPAERYIPVADQLCEAGRLGKRNNAGWYDYPDGKKSESAHVREVIEKYAASQNINRTGFGPEEIRSRLLAAMINEGFLIAQEGIAEKASDVDIVKISGFGFPRWKGGPLYYAEKNMGALREAMKCVADQSPNSWVISEALT